MKKIIIIGLCISLLLLGGCDTQSSEEKNNLCEDDCLSDGYQYGEWVGLNYCNCFNRTITNEILE